MVRRTAVLLLACLALLGTPGCGSDEEPASPDAGPAADAGDLLPFMSSECTSNEQCETDLCFMFNAKGPHCTHACTVDEDCEAPSPGCNNMGVCKAPDL